MALSAPWLGGISGALVRWNKERISVPRSAIGFLAGLVLIAGSIAAQASGLAIREWSATAQGNSYAGATAGCALAMAMRALTPR